MKPDRRSMNLVLDRIYRTLDRIESIDEWERHPRLAAMHADLVRYADAVKRRSAVDAIKERMTPAGGVYVSEYATLSGKRHHRRNSDTSTAVRDSQSPSPTPPTLTECHTAPPEAA